MRAVIWGSGIEAEYAYWKYRKTVDLQFFVDVENVGNRKKWQGNLEIKRPEELINYRDALIIITIPQVDEVKNFLQQIGHGMDFATVVFKPENFYFDIMEIVTSMRQAKKVINLGELVRKTGKIKVWQVGGIGGGSNFYDYVLIRAIAQRYKVQNYLEIGTYIGESIKSVSDICRKCHSLTIPRGGHLPSMAIASR